MKASNLLHPFIKEFESLHDGDLSKIGLQPKLDPTGNWTEGWGHLMTHNGKAMTVKDFPTQKSILPFSKIKTVEDADRYFLIDLKEVEDGVNFKLKVKVSQNKFDALVSHWYNCGFSSTMYKLVNSCAPEKDIKNWFTTKYITSGGVYLKGLQFRRNDEYEIWANINYKREYNLSI